MIFGSQLAPPQGIPSACTNIGRIACAEIQSTCNHLHRAANKEGRREGQMMDSYAYASTNDISLSKNPEGFYPGTIDDWFERTVFTAR